MRIELGDKVRDKVTGFEGIATGITKWLTGCDTVTVTPPIGKDGKEPERGHFDVLRLEVVQSGAVKLPSAKPDLAGTISAG